MLVRTRVEAHELGSTVNFEDRIGIGVRFGAQELGLQAIHYSNAGLRMPNQGAETFTLHYSAVL